MLEIIMLLSLGVNLFLIGVVIYYLRGINSIVEELKRLDITDSYYRVFNRISDIKHYLDFNHKDALTDINIRLKDIYRHLNYLLALEQVNPDKKADESTPTKEVSS